MSEPEERLVRALRDEADARDVDVPALLASTRERLERRRPARRRVVPVLAAAVAVAVVGAGVAVVQLADGDPRPGVAGTAPEVDHELTCPDRVAVDVSGAQRDFLPHLDGRGPAAVADEYDAPRWDFVEDGDSARLYLGNADGSLGSVATYDREGERWVLRAATACGNGSSGAPTAEGLRLGRHGGEPHPAEGVLDVGDPGITPVLVDDRPVYDYSGLVLRHRSIYAAPCGERLCLGIGEPSSGVHDEVVPSAPGSALHVVEVCFFQPDDDLRRTSPYRVMAVWDPTGTSTEMAAVTALATSIGELTTMQDLGELGPLHAGQLYEDPSWGGGRLWVAVVPRRDYDGVVASLRVGDERPVFSSLRARCGRVD